MSPFKPDEKTVYRKHCTSCGNEEQEKFEIISPRCVKCIGCGSVVDGVAEHAESSIYENQKNS